jgi:chromosome segregation ATPase
MVMANSTLHQQVDHYTALQEDRDGLKAQLAQERATCESHTATIQWRDDQVSKLQGEVKRLASEKKEAEASNRTLQQQIKAGTSISEKQGQQAQMLEAEVQRLQDAVEQVESEALQAERTSARKVTNPCTIAFHLCSYPCCARTECALRAQSCRERLNATTRPSVQVADAERQRDAADAALRMAQERFDSAAATQESMQHATLTAEVAALREALTQARAQGAQQEDELRTCRTRLSMHVRYVSLTSLQYA